MGRPVLCFRCIKFHEALINVEGLPGPNIKQRKLKTEGFYVQVTPQYFWFEESGPNKFVLLLLLAMIYVAVMT